MSLARRYRGIIDAMAYLWRISRSSAEPAPAGVYIVEAAMAAKTSGVAEQWDIIREQRLAHGGGAKSTPG